MSLYLPVTFMSEKKVWNIKIIKEEKGLKYHEKCNALQKEQVCIVVSKPGDSMLVKSSSVT